MVWCFVDDDHRNAITGGMSMSKSHKRRLKWLAWTDTSEKPSGSTINGGIMDEEGADAIKIATVLLPAGVNPNATHQRKYGPLELAAKCMNACDGIDPAAVPDLLAACQAWDEGFVDGEQLTSEQFRVWVNERRAKARAAMAKAKGLDQ